MNLIQISALTDARRRSAELHSISIRENARALSKFPDRGCGEAQPQRVTQTTGRESSNGSARASRCGWASPQPRSFDCGSAALRRIADCSPKPWQFKEVSD